MRKATRTSTTIRWVRRTREEHDCTLEAPSAAEFACLSRIPASRRFFSGRDGIEGGNGHICVAGDPRWNFAEPLIFELREGNQPQAPYSGQHACWPRVCIQDTASHPRAAEDCENRWFGNDFFTFVAKGSSGIPSAVDGVVYLSQGYNHPL